MKEREKGWLYFSLLLLESVFARLFTAVPFVRTLDGTDMNCMFASNGFLFSFVRSVAENRILLGATQTLQIRTRQQQKHLQQQAIAMCFHESQ